MIPQPPRPPGAEGDAGEANPLSLDLGQVRGQVVGEPPVPGSEGLGLRALGVPHDAEPIVVGVEADDAVMPDPELLPAAGYAGHRPA